VLRFWPNPFFVVLLLSACEGTPVMEELSPVVVVDPMTDSSISNPTQIAAGECDLFIYEHGTGTIAHRNAGGGIARLGRGGNGPGELRHVFALAALGDTAVSAVDWIRGRLVTYSSQGTALRDIPLIHHAPRHSFVGPILALDNGSFIDAPWGGRTVAPRAHDAVLDTSHLLYLVDSTGAAIRAWGALRDSVSRSGLARALQFVGDVALLGDTLLYLQFEHPTLHLFLIENGSRKPYRSIQLPRLRAENRSVAYARIVEGGKREVFRRPPLDLGATSMAVTSDGWIAITMRRPDIPEQSRGPDEGVWAREALFLLRSDGLLHAKFALDGRETRSGAFLDDGTYVRLYMADSSGAAGRRIGFYRLPQVSNQGKKQCLK
jgi:hypothetical protein